MECESQWKIWGFWELERKTWIFKITLMHNSRTMHDMFAKSIKHSHVTLVLQKWFRSVWPRHLPPPRTGFNLGGGDSITQGVMCKWANRLQFLTFFYPWSIATHSVGLKEGFNRSVCLHCKKRVTLSRINLFSIMNNI